jgi:hypothetical protein
MYSWEGFGSEIGGLWLRTLANIVKLAQLGGRVSQHNTNIEPHPTCCFCMIGWLGLSSSQQIVFIWVWSCSICICINMNMLRVKGEQHFCPKWDSVRLNHEPTCWIIPTITTWFLLEHLQVALADWVNPHMESNTCHKENLRWTPMFWRWCSAAVWLKDVQKLRPGNEHHSIRRKIHRIFPQRSTVKRVFKSGFICYDQYHCVLPGWWKRNIGSIICFCRPLQYPWDLAGSSGEGQLSPAQCLWMWQTQPFGTQTWLVWEIT